ncbi:hypothetical protein DPMN_158354 [Dreissena polymorpha]|uniref:Transmembrane protein n=1 Tax=Dreissena polymorpha TaxID=45954 RepID=A0A9D4EHQ0_DREPO|nr:hypothetical protein DPMN_158354 [Dreissena polymorpha]
MFRTAANSARRFQSASAITLALSLLVFFLLPQSCLNLCVDVHTCSSINSSLASSSSLPPSLLASVIFPSFQACELLMPRSLLLVTKVHKFGSSHLAWGFKSQRKRGERGRAERGERRSEREERRERERERARRRVEREKNGDRKES